MKKKLCSVCGRNDVRKPYSIYCDACFKNRSLAKFRKMVVDKYGNEYSSDMLKLKEQPYFTLQKFGDKYGITRERVRQMYALYFGHKYTKAKHNKRVKMSKELRSIGDANCSLTHRRLLGHNWHKHTEAAIEFLRQAKKRGIGIKTKMVDKTVYFVVGCKTIQVRSCGKKYDTGFGNSYYRFSYDNKNSKFADFTAAYIKPKNLFFIIPNHDERKAYYIPDRFSNYRNRRSPYERLENAWHLLVS